MSAPYFSKREFLKYMGVSLSGLYLGNLSFIPGGDAMVSKSYGGENPPVKVGYLPITDAAPLLMAYAKGYFKEEGLRVEKPVLIRGWSSLSEAFISGKLNLVHLLFPIPIYMRYKLNYPVKVVAWDHTNNSAITVVGSGNIRELPDLAGKRIAVPYWYSMHNLVLQRILHDFSIEPILRKRGKKGGRKETELLIMNPPDMPTALSAKTIDGYIVAEPFNAAGEIFAGGRILRFTGDVWKNHPCCIVAMHEKDLQRKEWSQRILNAVTKAQLFCKDHLEEVARILSKEGENLIPLPERVLKRALTRYTNEKSYLGGAITHPEWNTGRIGFQPYPFPAHTEKMLSLFQEAKLEGDRSFLNNLTGEKVVRDLIDYHYVGNAVAKAGGLRKFIPQGDFKVSKQFGYNQEVTFAI